MALVKTNYPLFGNLFVGGNAKTIYQTGKHATHNTEIIDQLK